MNETMTKKVNGTTARRAFTPRVDILEQADKLVLFVDLPGVKGEDVELNFEKGELALRARREVPSLPGRALVSQFEGGEYFRSFLLSQDIAADKISAELKHGVLTVELPRSPAALPRRIGVKS